MTIQLKVRTRISLSQEGTHYKGCKSLVNAINSGEYAEVYRVMKKMYAEAKNYNFVPKVADKEVSGWLVSKRKELLIKYLCRIVYNPNSKKRGIVHGVNYSENGGKASLHLQVVLLDDENGVRNTTWSPNNAEILGGSTLEHLAMHYDLK